MFNAFRISVQDVLFFVLQDGKVIVWDAFTTNKVYELLQHAFKLIINNKYDFFDVKKKNNII